MPKPLNQGLRLLSWLMLVLSVLIRPGNAAEDEQASEDAAVEQEQVAQEEEAGQKEEPAVFISYVMDLDVDIEEHNFCCYSMTM